MTAFFIFMGEKCAEVKNANPDFKVGDIAKELSKTHLDSIFSFSFCCKKKAI